MFGVYGGIAWHKTVKFVTRGLMIFVIVSVFPMFLLKRNELVSVMDRKGDDIWDIISFVCNAHFESKGQFRVHMFSVFPMALCFQSNPGSFRSSIELWGCVSST